jgi:hypothetical protein
LTVVADELTTEQIAEMEFDEDLRDYLDVALAMTGFSKGTANVTPADRHKLLPILRHYAKDPHPFTSCVRDNRKRFGPRAEAICAVVKDLIVGNTRWRGKGKVYTPRALAASEVSYEDMVAEFALKSVPDEFVAFLEEVTEEEIGEMLEDITLAGQRPTKMGAPPDAPTSQGGPAGDNSTGAVESVGGIELPPANANYRPATDATQSCATCVHFQRHPEGDDGYCDLYKCSSDAKYVSDGWESGTPGANQTALSAITGEEGATGMLLSEVFLADGEVEPADAKQKTGPLWKTIARVGTWMFSPGKGQKPIPRPLVFTEDGDVYVGKDKIVVPLSELYRNFKAGAVEHVTIPTSHNDGVLENTGDVIDVRMVKDKEGKPVLQGLLNFTEPDVEGKVRRKSIKNVSSGILFDYIKKDTGHKFKAVLGHVALTNKPWLNGMAPFGVEASEEPATIMGFSEDVRANGGGDNGMSETLLERLGLSSEDEVESRLKELEALKAKDRERDIDLKCSEWEGEKKPAAAIVEARTILLADDGTLELHLSEGSKQVTVTPTDIVERMMKHVPAVDLSEDKSGGEGRASEGGAPPDDTKDENEKADLSADERVEATRLFMHDGKTEAEAIEIVKAKREKKND